MLDLRLKRLAQRTVANDVADKIDSAAREFGASVDEIVETFECNQPADADDARLVGRDCRARRFNAGCRKTFEIDPVVNSVNFRRGIRTTLTEQIPASITASSFNLDDLEILDLPPLENGKTQEYTTNPRSESEGGGKEIVSMSSELMDILVQRVVEKLSKDK